MCSSSAAGSIGLAVAWRARSAACACRCSSATRPGRRPRAWPPACSRPSPEVEFGDAGAARARARAALGGACGRRSHASCRRAAALEVGLLRDRHAAARARRRRGARARAPARVPPLARPARAAAARERGARARAGARARRCGWRSRRRDDHSVDPRAGARARCAPRARAAACELREHARVRARRADATGARAGVRARRRRAARRRARWCSPRAPWSGEVGACRRTRACPCGPCKGQILRLRDPVGARAARHARALRGRLPRAARRRPLRARRAPSRSGASTRRPTAGGVYELLRDAHELVPGVSELEIEELSVGLRPGTPDNAPADRRGRARRADVGDRPPPQRHPARAAHRRAGARGARMRRARRRRRRCSAACEPAALRSAPSTRARRRPRARADGGGSAVIVLNGQRTRAARRRDARERARAPRLRPRRARGRGGGRRRGRAARARGSSSRWREDARVEVLTAMQGG